MSTRPRAAEPRRASCPPAPHGARRQAYPTPHAGTTCPRCRKALLDYDSLLELRCPRCGGRFGSGGFT